MIICSKFSEHLKFHQLKHDKLRALVLFLAGTKRLRHTRHTTDKCSNKDAEDEKRDAR